MTESIISENANESAGPIVADDNAKQTLAFLRMLDPNAAGFFYRTFDDTGACRKELTRKYDGKLKPIINELRRLNAAGAGVFVVVNEGGQVKADITRVRAVFADTDGAPLEPLLALAPHMVVESSLGKWHVYWLVTDDFQLDQFSSIQEAIAAKYGTDPAVKDLPRVMRLPGFNHHKGTPYPTRLIQYNKDLPRYTADEIVQGLGLNINKTQPASQPLFPVERLGAKSVSSGSYRKLTPESLQRVLSKIDHRDESAWSDVANALARVHGEEGSDLFMRFSSGELANDPYENFNASECSARYTRALREAEDNHTSGYGSPRLVALARLRDVDVEYEGDSSPLEVSGASGDIKNGQIFAKSYMGKILFVHETGEVLSFQQDSGWVRAAPGEADRCAKRVVDVMRKFAADLYIKAPEDPKTKRLMAHVERSSNLPKLRAMIDMGKSEDGMTVKLADLDADPMLLGVANGVLDLRKMMLVAPAPSILVTKRTAVCYDPYAKAPTWIKFVERITRQHPDVAGFLQRLAGYLLTGDVSEQCFAFAYGHGRNGKTTFCDTLYWLLGDYAVVLPTESLMTAHRDPGSASPDLMMLKGIRYALSSETEDGARLAESRIKALTGGDTITARNPYGLYASWIPTHKHFMFGNHRPIISGGDHGIWRRVRLIPFVETISDAECDPHLMEKLRDEGAGILNWALDGLREWKRTGLNQPQSVRAASDAYRNDMDVLGQWLEDHCEFDEVAQTATSELYKAFKTWSTESGWRPMTRQSFGRRLQDRNIPTRKNSTMYAIGVRLNKQGVLAAAKAI